MKEYSSGDAYLKLGLELVIHFVIMYLVMYTMVASLSHFRLNLNNLYMTLMMVTPMALLMLVLMRHMYPSKRINIVVSATAIVVFALSFWGMRTQMAVSDEEFLRSMIPHHSGAILMCREAAIADPEVRQLCRDIVESQEREITQMEAILDRM